VRLEYDGKASKMASGNGELKEKIYQRLCRSKVAVFSGDIVDPSELVLALCGSHLPVTGDELLEILIELALEGRMVIWREGDIYGFLPTKNWQQEMDVIENPALRAECEAMRLKNEDIVYLRNSIAASLLVLSNSASPKNARRSVIKI